jgi:hypothetical protein
MHDGFLLQPGNTSMVTSRDAQLAGDLLRYDGANQEEIWQVYATRGLGVDAISDTELDREPIPSFVNPLRDDNASVRFAPLEVDGGGVPSAMTVHVGAYEARSTPAAVAEGGQASDAVGFTPATYEFIVTAPGYGGYRFTREIAPGEDVTLQIPLRRNLASAEHGSEVSAIPLEGGTDGETAATNRGNLRSLVDDTESSNFAYLREGDVRGKHVTVALGGGAQTVREVAVSAALRPAMGEDPAGDGGGDGDENEEEDDPPYDTGGQNRFTALREFAIQACDASTGADCASDAGFTTVYTSAPDAFPGVRPRPTAPDLTLRTFEIPETRATHLRLVVVNNQCTGGPLYTGDADRVLL